MNLYELPYQLLYYGPNIICNSRAFQDKLMVEKFSKIDKNFIKTLGHFHKIV
jgi:hypothetical protein